MTILVLNQYFPPDRAATAILLGQLSKDLSKKHDVSVICGSPTYSPENSKTDIHMKMKILRIPLIPLSRSNLMVRVLNYFLFLTGALFRALLEPKHDLVMCWTDPPIVGAIGCILKMTKGSNLLFVSQDVHPEAAIAMKQLRNPLMAKILKTVSQFILKTSDSIVALGADMKKKLLAKGCEIHKLHIIPNWQDLKALQPDTGLSFRKALGIDPSTFIVMHSGNIGFSQDFETLLQAAQMTLNEKYIQYLVVGDGGKEREVVQFIQNSKLVNVRHLPYQPNSQLSQSLSAANLHYVSLLPEITGYIVPSKVYGILAVARPMIANVLDECEVASIIREAGCGILVERDAKKLAEEIKAASQNPQKIIQMGTSGRKWLEKHSSREIATQKYDQLILSLHTC